MQKYSINKGTGSCVEFNGLKAQYLFYLAGGFLGVLIVVMMLYILGVSSYVCLFLASVLIVSLTCLVFHFNYKYGQYGLLKLVARRSFPKYIISRECITTFFEFNSNT
ncbi:MULTISPECIES: DUF4133 domain-containing protein [Myroides]|uniref:DUF4133 domain-containing protein n=1 Tax=Myroides albus TaxID=2562892 RepID=A0A6I3LLI4_9FLAO|nr:MULTISPECIES: DUF4133 domain-containing protein [Myroides]MTG98714.1 DUF4133 domain-containing protein [Myroides albus]MVX35500.1 DUF4133 domain-containing protein [Myroides sp. LoEW2-1]UVD79087.1 DUF4133 domain-containing protein [Myroides albus]